MTGSVAVSSDLGGGAARKRREEIYPAISKTTATAPKTAAIRQRLQGLGITPLKFDHEMVAVVARKLVVRSGLLPPLRQGESDDQVDRSKLRIRHEG